MARALERICRQADDAIAGRVNIIVLSDRALGAGRAPIPALLAVAAVHHHLVRQGTRLRAGIIARRDTNGDPATQNEPLKLTSVPLMLWPELSVSVVPAPSSIAQRPSSPVCVCGFGSADPIAA